MMNVDENQQKLSSNSSIHITEETPLINNEQIIPEVYDWNTSLLSQVKIFLKKSLIY